MHKAVVLLIVLLVSCSTVSAFDLADAQGKGKEICDFLLANTDAQGAHMPSGVPFKNEVFEAFTLEGELIGSMSVEDGIINGISCSSPGKPVTIKVTVKDQDTVLNIFRAQDPLAAWNEERAQGNINLEGQAFGTKMKVEAIKTAAKVLGWFR